MQYALLIELPVLRRWSLVKQFAGHSGLRRVNIRRWTKGYSLFTVPCFKSLLTWNLGIKFSGASLLSCCTVDIINPVDLELDFLAGSSEEAIVMGCETGGRSSLLRGVQVTLRLLTNILRLQTSKRLVPLIRRFNRIIYMVQRGGIQETLSYPREDTLFISIALFYKTNSIYSLASLVAGSGVPWICNEESQINILRETGKALDLPSQKTAPTPPSP